MSRLCFVLFSLLIAVTCGVAQEADSVQRDSLAIRPVGPAADTINVTLESEHSPGKASIYSAVLPGLGQVYNNKHWKVPIIYGAFFTFGYLIYDNNVKYQYFRRNLIAELDNDPETENITGREVDNLQSNRDRFRRFRDLNMILLTITYLLQIADAHIDAHLLEFNVSQDITVGMNPSVSPAPRSVTTGFTVNIGFR